MTPDTKKQYDIIRALRAELEQEKQRRAQLPDFIGETTPATLARIMEQVPGGSWRA